MNLSLALIAMPWARFDNPSPALGVLAAEVRRQLPDVRVACFHEYVTVARELQGVYLRISERQMLGENLYAAQIYPERKKDVLAELSNMLSDDADADKGEFCEFVDRVLSTHLEDLAQRVAGEYHVVGLTTTYSQLFASLALARLVKERNPQARIVLGGPPVNDDKGAVILDLYPFVDAIVSGEGEKPLCRYLREQSCDSTGKATDAQRRVLPEESYSSADDLPVPDYSDFMQEASERVYSMFIPIEGSRGCWWNRSRETGDPLKGCYFCGLVHWGYREKSVQRIAGEMRELSLKHGNVRFVFLDSVVRRKGISDLARAIKEQAADFHFFYEMRAHMKPLELLELQEAGCRMVQIGIEGLSTRYLKRLGKGTTTIQNLQAMKTCYELGIRSNSNLITGFPGATPEEIAETAETIRRYAICYEPPNCSQFMLHCDSALAKMPEKFGVDDLTNHEDYRRGLPDHVWERVRMPWMSFRNLNEEYSWEDVNVAMKEWRELHRNLDERTGIEWFSGARPLYYHDGGEFFEIVDLRHGFQVFNLEPAWRAVYFFCQEIRTWSEIMNRFSGEHGEPLLREIIQGFQDEDLMYIENGQHLSLAVADDPRLAARRIRAEASVGLSLKYHHQ